MPCNQFPDFVHGIDANGNGILDIVIAPANILGDIYTLHSGGATASLSNEGTMQIIGACGGSPFFHMDADGDGLVDLVRQQDFWVVGNTPSGFVDRGPQKPTGLPS